MKELLVSIILAFVIMCMGCTPSHQDKNKNGVSYQNLVSLSPSDDSVSAQPSQIYIDSVDVEEKSGKKVLVIHGSFPDGCTRLESAEHTVRRNEITINLTAWRDPEMMCAQVLTQFTFIYDKLDPNDLEERSTIIVNGTTYNI